MTPAELAAAVCARLGHHYRPAADVATAGMIQRELEVAIGAAVIAEREACAKTAETAITGTDNISVHEQRGAEKAAAAIRARNSV